MITSQQLERMLHAHANHMMIIAIGVSQGSDLKTVIDFFLCETERMKAFVMAFDTQEVLAADPRRPR